MIDDSELRERLGTVFSRSVTRGNPSESARRGTREFDDLMDELEEGWELDDDELDDIVEVRRCGDSFEIRLKGEDGWELLEDEDDDEDSGEEE